ncbi:glutamate receptor ionotropic, kainate 2-like isoform X2 [Contarinia nasturtii]|uniref:glutamate receptor ionotropic, kainate 2-like isoform X2 n=1 Tax=Contarinia nasturtii TaxID=265458 RepID=UPI0012D3B390|nr:glutamate receptor ionotropic, kainate 2-like isoform X2 [Contarinia nasturtii]
MTFCTFLIILSIINSSEAQKIIKFGVFLNANDVESLELFNIAILRQNAFNTQFRLEPIIKKIESIDGFQAEQKVCEMVESGAVAIIGPKSYEIADVVASICNELNIPHLVSYHRTPEINKNPYHMFTRNIHPDTKLLAKALVDTMQNYQWTRFAIIYDSDEALIRLNGILEMFTIAAKSVTVHKLTGKDMIKHILKDITKAMESHVIIDCSIENIAEIFKQGLDVKMNEHMFFFITMPDGHTINIPELVNYNTSNIRAIRLMASEDVEAMNIIDQWKKTKKYFNAEQSIAAEQVYAPNKLKLEAALIRDAITVVYSALQERKLYRKINEPPTRCDLIDPYGAAQNWQYGSELLQNIDNKIAMGITGPIRFDQYYKTREDFSMDIVEYSQSENSFKRVNGWNAIEGLKEPRKNEVVKPIKMEGQHFRVVTVEVEPYLTVKKGTHQGNERYEGFVKDFMDEIANTKKFTYELYLSPGNQHGKHNHITGRWDGIVGELLRGKAQFAICDFTITHERMTAIDFSSPFMSLGISILYYKKEDKAPGLLNFLQPLSTKVWLYTLTALLCVSIAAYFLAKITSADWLAPHPCDEDPEELENIWNMHNCIWLTVGSIMQQGCDILPKGIPSRLATASWWFFALIVTSSYTANMAAFLTKQQMEESFKNVADLAKETKIKYGLMSGGSTEEFFKKMWARMEHNPDVFVETNNKGVLRVKQSEGSYAFLMESATIDYEVQRECGKLIRVGGLLNSAQYGVGMPKSSPFRDHFNEAILDLKERRIIHNLKEKWWKTLNYKEQNGEKLNCPIVEEANDSDDPDLDVEHILGVFIVLMSGIGIAIFVGILEFLWNVRKVSVALKITPSEAFRQELLFACKVWLSRKPVLEQQQESQSLSSFDSSGKK